ncbi:MAG: LptF/LptG family permease, partial [Gemmatimonadaceae bacterium]
NEQVLNQVTTGFYMRIGKLDRESNKMTDVTIYDLTAPFARKTIYADSGDLAVTPDQKDLQLMLFDGFQQELVGDTKHGLRRSYFRSQAVRVKDVGGSFEQTGNDDWKGDREKSVCEMQSEYVGDAREYARVRELYIITASKAVAPGQKTVTVPRARPATGGLAKLYCNGLALIFRTQTAIPSGELLPQPVVGDAPSPPTPTTNVQPFTAGAPTPGASAVVAAGGVPGSVPSPAVAPPLSPGMQAQLEAAKASLAAPAQAADSLAIQAAKTRKVIAQQAAQQAAQVAAQQAAQKNAVPVFKPMVDVIAGDSNKVQAVVIGGKSDSTAPGTAPVTAPVNTPAGVPVVAQAAPSATATAPPAASAPVSVVPAAPAASIAIAPPPSTTPPPAVTATVTPASGDSPDLEALSVGSNAELNAARSQLMLVRASMDGLSVEIQKKFALSFACIVFVLFGPPIALRFPRGGVGATLGISLVVFGLYYICLMAGETLADDGKLEPIVAMWIANVIFTLAGLLLLMRLEKTADASRGGGVRAWFEDRRMRRATRRAVRVADPTVSA